MLTIFSVPKPFSGNFAFIQRNAIESWIRLDPRPEIVLFGDEPGVGEIARELRLIHRPDVARNEFGTPLLDDVFTKAQGQASADTICFVNTDIILMSDFAAAIRRVRHWGRTYLMVGRRRNLPVKEVLDFEDGWEAELLRDAITWGEVDSPYWIDYFVFRRGLFTNLPPFAVGRPAYDNWLIWRARSLGACVIDAGAVVAAIHQRHDYSHVSDDLEGVVPVSGGPHPLSRGIEAVRNRELLGSWDHLQTIAHATHVLTSSGDVRRARAPAHLAAELGLHWRRLVEYSRPLRHRLGLRAGLARSFKSMFSSPDERR